jgi:hypothetical protein
MIPTFNLNKHCAAMALSLNEECVAQDGDSVDANIFLNAFNGSNLSALTELHLTSILRGYHIGAKQTNYDVLLVRRSKPHWSLKIEQRNMKDTSNLGPSTTAGKGRYFDKDKFVIKMDDCHSLIIYDLNSDPNNIDIYEIPTKLVAGLWKLNVIGTEVVIKEKKQGYRNAMVTYNQFKRLFPIEDYRFVINPDGHKMKDETPEGCWDKAQKRKGFRQLKECVVEFDFDTVDFAGIFDED